MKVSSTEFPNLPYNSFVHQLQEELQIESSSKAQIAAWKETFLIFKQLSAVPSLDKLEFIFEYELPFSDGLRTDILMIINNQLFIIEFKNRSNEKEDDFIQLRNYKNLLKYYHSASQLFTVKSILLLNSLKNYKKKKEDVLVISKQTFINEWRSFKPKKQLQSLNIKYLIDGYYKPNLEITKYAESIYLDNLDGIKTPILSESENAYNEIIKIINQAKNNLYHAVIFVLGEAGSGKSALALKLGKTTEGKIITKNKKFINLLKERLGHLVNIHSSTAVIREFFSGRNIEENQITIIDEAQRVWGENRIQGWYNESISEYEILLQHIKRLKQWSTTIIFIGIDQQLASNETSYYDQWIYAMKTLKLPSHKFRIFKPSSFNLEDSTYLITNEDKLRLTNSVRNNQSHQFTSLINSIIANPNRKGLKKLIKLFKSEGLQLFISRSLEDCATFFNSIPGEKKPSTALIGTPICSIDENLELGIEYESAQKVKIKNIFDQEYPISSDNLIKNGLTQFQVLGLEFDIPIIQWNADYLYYNNKWNFDWEKRIIGFGFFYIKNAYRVLLTRGRNGLIIYIPQHWKFNETYNYFKNLGFENLDSSTIEKTKSNFQNTMF